MYGTYLLSVNKTFYNIKIVTTDDECFVSENFSVLKNYVSVWVPHKIY